jgi:DNA-binding FadR family transcriptional regulator
MGRRTGTSSAATAESVPATVRPIVQAERVRSERMSNNHRAWLDSPRVDKLSERLARSILSDIVEGKLPVGATLPSEMAMMESHGVGRNSLREALRILEIHGLVKIKPGPRGGPVVASVSSSDLARSASFYFNAIGATFGDLLRARLVIEPMMARLAALNINLDSAEVLSTALAHHEEADSDAERWLPASASFHRVVNGLSGNPVLDLVCGALMDVYLERVPASYPTAESDDVRRAHRLIVKAIIAGDGDLAESRMRRHIERQVTMLKRLQPELLQEPIDWR